MGAFVFNNTSDDGEVCDDGGGWRRGGPLMYHRGVVNNQAQARPLKVSVCVCVCGHTKNCSRGLNLNVRLLTNN